MLAVCALKAVRGAGTARPASGPPPALFLLSFGRGFNIGVRLIDEFLAKAKMGRCSSFRETAEVRERGTACGEQAPGSSSGHSPPTWCSGVFHLPSCSAPTQPPPLLWSLPAGLGSAWAQGRHGGVEA